MSTFGKTKSLASIGIIGSGISGMAAAIELAASGHQVRIFEKNSGFGGRGRSMKAEGYSFDMGPSWYWMPDVFEQFFNKHGRSTSDYFTLDRLDPSYRIFFKDGLIDAPAEMKEIEAVFEEKEAGSAAFLRKFLKEAQYKYEVGMSDFVTKPSLSLLEFMDLRILSSLFRLEMLKSIESVIHQGIKNEQLRSWLSFPVLFLGAKPSDTPALYSLMNYADMELGTWYPKGGMTRLFEAFYKLALEKGVKFSFEDAVESIGISGKKFTHLVSASGTHKFDFLISSADYHHTDTVLLPVEARQYSDAYWESRKMAPGSLIFYLGVRRKLPGLLHHNLFFDADFQEHAADIYDLHRWPEDPLFYVCMSSATDDSVAPAGHENLFILMPIAAGLKEDEALKNQYLDLIIGRMETRLGYSFREDIDYCRSFCTEDFISEYHSFKGNAYGLANTLDQTAILKPRVRHKKISNLFFAGQLSHPGPGLPPSMISGQITARLIQKETSKSSK